MDFHSKFFILPVRQQKIGKCAHRNSKKELSLVVISLKLRCYVGVEVSKNVCSGPLGMFQAELNVVMLCDIE